MTETKPQTLASRFMQWLLGPIGRCRFCGQTVHSRESTCGTCWQNNQI